MTRLNSYNANVNSEPVSRGGSSPGYDCLLNPVEFVPDFRVLSFFPTTVPDPSMNSFAYSQSKESIQLAKTQACAHGNH